MKYNQIQDFLNDDTFVQWILLAKNAAYWQDFLVTNPEKIELVEKARLLILELNKVEGEEGQQLDKSFVWERINKQIKELENPEMTIIPIWKQPSIRWVASFLLIVGFSLVIWKSQTKNKVSYQALVASIEEKNTVIERINKGDMPMQVHLEDGSIITLEKNSKLSFPSHFDNNKRTVILSGEAFFEITQKPDKPFYVYANEVVTKVLGTSFRIRAFDDDKKVTVNVRTGKVFVYNQRKINLSDPETNALILFPNQQAIYNRPTNALNKKLVENPMPIVQKSTAPSPNQFDEVAASKIFEVLEIRYGVKIVYNEERLSDCFITTKLRNESLYDHLDLICKIIGGSYKEVDTQIIIDSKGCK